METGDRRLQEEVFDARRRSRALKNMGWDGKALYNIRRKSFDLEEGRAAITVELCEMKKVHLQDLPNLRSFSSGDTLKWSSLLDNVVLNHCPNIKKFGLGMIKESQSKYISITENDPQTKVVQSTSLKATANCHGDLSSPRPQINITGP
ncbi:hypothetical protein V8G54_032821 [Vigna mungo]|uniref:Uncharacterized protein n=1 Tax=Vigna mungo TaxID=3915 RepID=A0AAQ3RIA1_VIGMU